MPPLVCDTVFDLFRSNAMANQFYSTVLFYSPKTNDVILMHEYLAQE